MDKSYDPSIFESKWYNYWLEGGYFHSEVDESKEPYVIVIPPPNITSRLHMGHGLNNTIQDILVRWKKMSGYNVLWMPGTDHAGIATQNVVERDLMRNNLSRHSFSREEFVSKVWDWKDKHGSIIIDQLKQLGSSCDWERERFTMDSGLSYAVREVFVRLYEAGLIYRGKYIVNWCPRCTTALSQEEAEHKELKGYFYHIKYPIKGLADKYLEIATTRPETMLGDTAVAVNPKDERYKALVGQKVILPLMGREIPIIADDYARLDFGSGAVKVTPAHDPNDFLIGRRHNLEQINVMNADGTMNENAGEYSGLDRFECRDRVLNDLKDGGFFIREEAHTHSVGHCYRCSTVVEPYLSDQWFVSMKELAKDAIEVVKSGSIKFYPAKWTKVYLNWMENIEDWCISRQIWWGHRIPVWTCLSCDNTIVSRIDVERCDSCGSKDIKQDDDVLDTWFSSWLWPFSTFGWPLSSAEDELSYFYPTSVLSTAPEILFFWVARMIMAGLYFLGDIPFREVYLHSTVRDKLGRKMSKSLGNGIDPLDVIEKHGADALRFTITSLAPIGQDIKLAFDGKQNDFLNGSRFANKLWNVSRYILLNVEDNDWTSDLSGIELGLGEDWLLHRLSVITDKTIYNLNNFRFNDLALLLYDFVWHDFCDWYVEFSKVDLYKEGNEARKRVVLSVLLYVLSDILKLLHPIMPYITEEIWHSLPSENASSKAKESILLSSYPAVDDNFINEAGEKDFVLIKELIYQARNIRGEMNVPHSKRTNLVVKAKDEVLQRLIFDNRDYILSLTRSDTLELRDSYNNAVNCATSVLTGVELFIPLEGIIDIDKEKSRIQKGIEKLGKEIAKIRARLDNKTFLNKARAEVIEKERAKLSEGETNLSVLEKNISFLS